MGSEGRRGEPAPFPERIGRYEVLLPIASGGMATVYLARATSVGGFEREVALKLTHAHLRSQPEFADALMDEAVLAGKIRHPNVVSVLDVDEDPHGIYLVMDYVEGESVAGLMRRARTTGNRIPADVAMRIIDDTLTGLHAAHQLANDAGELLGVIHRDVTPQNILVGIDGVARLTDFGVAKAATRLASTDTGVVKGKIAYMSPEQARGKDLDRTCDIWAAGVVAWELLAGIRLYESTNDTATLLRVVSDPPPRLRTVEPDIPEAIERIVARALEMEREARYQTTDELGRALAKAADETCGRADHRTVGAYVSGLVEARLAKRRAKIAEVLELRRRMGRIAASATAGATSSAPHDTSSAAAPAEQAPGEEDETTALPSSEELVLPLSSPTTSVPSFATGEAHTQTDAISVSTTGSRRRRQDGAGVGRTPAVIVGAALVMAVVVVMAIGLIPEGHEAVAVADAETSVATPVAATGKASPKDTGTELHRRQTPPVDDEVQVEVLVVSDVEVSSVQVGKRRVEFDPPFRVQVLKLEPDETDETFTVIAQDGRETTAALDDAGAEVNVQFGTKAKAREKPRPAVARPPAGKRRLLGNPYKPR